MVLLLLLLLLPSLASIQSSKLAVFQLAEWTSRTRLLRESLGAQVVVVVAKATTAQDYRMTTFDVNQLQIHWL